MPTTPPPNKTPKPSMGKPKPPAIKPASGPLHAPPPPVDATAGNGTGAAHAGAGTPAARRWKGAPTSRLTPSFVAEAAKAARREINGERASISIQPSGLVQAALLRTPDPGTKIEPNHTFLWKLKRAMHQVLIDHARAKATLMRGGGTSRRERVDVDTVSAPSPAKDVDTAPAERVFAALKVHNKDWAQVVFLQFHFDWTDEQIAANLGISVKEVESRRKRAMEWMRRHADDQGRATGHI